RGPLWHHAREPRVIVVAGAGEIVEPVGPKRRPIAVDMHHEHALRRLDPSVIRRRRVLEPDGVRRVEEDRATRGGARRTVRAAGHAGERAGERAQDRETERQASRAIHGDKTRRLRPMPLADRRTSRKVSRMKISRFAALGGAAAIALAVLTNPATAQSRALRFRAVVTGDGRVIPGGIVLIRGDSIVAVGDARTAVPITVPVLDLSRYTAIPG